MKQIEQPRGLVNETPAFIDDEGETLFGILTAPDTRRTDTAVIHLRGGNQGPSSGRNRTSVRLCRRVAQEGFLSLRFDYRGVGESTGVVERFRHDEPFTPDVTACADWLRDRGIERFVLVGECFGARTALASWDLSGLMGLVLISTPVRDAEKSAGRGTRPLVRHRSLAGYVLRALNPAVVRSMANPKKRRRYARAARAALHAAPSRSGDGDGPTWVSSAFLEQFESVVTLQLPVLLLNGEEDPSYEDFARAKSGRFGALLESGAGRFQQMILSGRVAAWTDTHVQEQAIELIAEWLTESFADATDDARIDEADLA